MQMQIKIRANTISQNFSLATSLAISMLSGSSLTSSRKRWLKSDPKAKYSPVEPTSRMIYGI
jgi:hypothetical protein|tara:strand:+ start:270 stop:455 length:186 start_codon:yes stop_codon:yes gene_type:complete